MEQRLAAEAQRRKLKQKQLAAKKKQFAAEA
jgi:hypothetical protein